MFTKITIGPLKFSSRKTILFCLAKKVLSSSSFVLILATLGKGIVSYIHFIEDKKLKSLSGIYSHTWPSTCKSSA